MRLLSMQLAIAGFAVGVLVLQLLPALPSTAQLYILSGLLALLVVASAWGMRGRFVRLRIPLIVLLAGGCGFIWAAWHAHGRIADALPVELEWQDIDVNGVVRGLPRRMDRAVRFVFQIESATYGGQAVDLPERVELSWYPPRDRTDIAAPRLKPGQRWRLTVRLKRPHGFVNPYGFDYEAWLLERNIRATGYVRPAPDNEMLAEAVPGLLHTIDRARDTVRTRFAASFADNAGSGRYAGVLTALAVGDQQAIPAEQWEVFRRTAVTHLLSISGLHVSMVAVLAGMLAGWIWRLFPALTLRIAARRVAVLAGLLTAVWYGLMAGMGIPVQRALIMLAAGALALMTGRETSAGRVLALALLCVLLFDPWAVLSAGFWLSFGAVGVIIHVVSGRSRPRPGWLTATHVQIAITLVTMPLLLLLFNAFSLISPFANAFAIPLVSFIITPLALLAIVLPVPELVVFAHWVAGGMMRCLEVLAALPFALWRQAAAPPVLVFVGIAGLLWFLLPRGTPARGAALLAVVPLFAWAPARPDEGAFSMRVLDVGHGTAVHVQTANHDLLYDAGPAYGPVSDAGERVLLPYFAAMGVVRLDRLVLSHGDADHIGGAESLLNGMPVDALLSSLPPEHALLQTERARLLECEAGMTWHWDGIDFEVLYPGAADIESAQGKPGRENNRSCVLRVVSRWGEVLLTGDIESAVERRLVRQLPDKMVNKVVLVPHHGSRSSSSERFVMATQAAHAIYSVGYLNAFRHPHPQVRSKWRDAGAQTWRTDLQGAILVDVTPDGVKLMVQRNAAPRYWYERLDNIHIRR